MYKISAFVVCVAALGTAACSSNKKDGGADGTGASGGAPALNFGGGAGTGTFGGTLVGGVLDITPEQATALRSGACAGWAASTEAQPAILDLVVDVSGSMSADAPGGGGSKWVVTQGALTTAIADLPDATGLGIMFYPNLADPVPASTTARPVSTCVNVDAMIGVELLGATHRAAVNTALANATAQGGTPTHDAYRHALVNGMIPSALPGNKFMLLITDGQPTYSQNCIGDGLTIHPVDYRPIVAEIQGAYDAFGIRTFVVGSPGSERNVSTNEDVRPWLSEAARAGGTGTPGCTDDGPTYCHMDMTQAPDFGVALAEGLKTITGQIISCDYPLPTPPTGETVDPDFINVVFTDGTGQAKLILQSTAADCTEGWQLVNNDTIVLCGDSCTQVKADKTASLEVLGGCATIPPPQH
jgi:hypothetical protein